jgi:hypothetical protein
MGIEPKNIPKYQKHNRTIRTTDSVTTGIPELDAPPQLFPEALGLIVLQTVKLLDKTVCPPNTATACLCP